MKIRMLDHYREIVYLMNGSLIMMIETIVMKDHQALTECQRLNPE